MEFQSPLERATLIRRYKRFLADVILADGTEAVAHCPNPGAMTGLADRGQEIWVMRNDDPRKKLRYSWKLSQVPSGALVVVDTMLANRVVKEMLGSPEAAQHFGAFESFRSEPRLPDGGRADFAILRAGCEQLVEVKSVSLSRHRGLAEFPDTKTARGARHLETLAALAREGQSCAVLFLVMRHECDRIAVAHDIDPVFSGALSAAREAGVEIWAKSLDVTTKGLWLQGDLTWV